MDLPCNKSLYVTGQDAEMEWGARKLSPVELFVCVMNSKFVSVNK